MISASHPGVIAMQKSAQSHFDRFRRACEALMWSNLLVVSVDVAVLC